jgi:hypothetical protein
MAEASIFIGLTASVAQEFQAIAISGLFLAGNIGVISGLVGSSAVMELSLRNQLIKGLATYPNKNNVCHSPIFMLC